MSEDGQETVITRRPIQQRKVSAFRRYIINPIEQVTRPPNKKMERT